MKILMTSALDLHEPEKGSSGSPQKRTIDFYINQGDSVSYVTGSKAHLKLTSFNYNESKGLKIFRFELPEVINRFETYKKIGFFARAIKWFLYQLQTFVLLIRLKVWEYDILYAYEIEAVPVSWLLSKMFSKPLVTRFQGSIVPTKISAYTIIQNWQHLLALYAHSNLTIMTNDGTQGDQIIKKVRGNLTGVEFLMNGIGREFFNIEQRTCFAENRGIRIYCCGRLVDWKNHDRNIKVLAKVLKNQIDAELIVIGDGPNKRSLQDLAENLGVTKNVRFVGAVEHNEIIKYIGESDVYISNYSYSNFGKTMMEAMAGAKAIITTDVGDTAKFIVDQQNGLIVDDNDIEAMAEKICSLFQNRNHLCSLGRNARLSAEQNFWSWEARFRYERKKLLEILPIKM
jgi:glycosyltransferase involved in cell wall biosynthesis